ncbi:hypothetical protein FIA58_004470 [Flavobacterium jejuense]|uniref:Uncharacterized protein n=1 Tax=Flavobacterium jejuense TaxID=1544455 RepID=A0ABX0IPD4_9FLAO|nr:hypothetical protein [Flavobacterium jejuense]NHN24925.1 hypothetical protein [Flavobacterium jejuense]
MKEINYIIDLPLPITQDFKSLKKEGLAHIQKVSGNEWTNLNPSDPGVTILDQLCYALTELGYCNDFPISDILTNSDDKLILKDQFYLPKEILTTSPITCNDYIKYIVDEVNEVENVVLLPIQSNLSYIKGVYIVYLSIVSTVKKPIEITTICRTTFYRLNKRRNMGELFMMPLPLEKITYTLNGKLQISNEVEVSKTLSLIENKINTYIFPKAIQEEDDQLLLDGEDTDTIYNGPEMRHGWISDANLGQKKDTITTRNLINIILSIEGVINIQELQISGAKNSDFVTSTTSQLLSFDLNKLEITYTNLKNDNSTTKTNALSLPDLSFDTASNNEEKLPKGKYRDINSYYSIQNTFPEIYAVGENAINSNASDFQIAQSRQLKGYLTLFDQILANQFSQLANVPQLFSFKNGITGTPSELKNFYTSKTSDEKEHLKYPVPYLSFSPTYFYQPLYTIPNIKPLLKNNDVFNFSLETRTKNVAEEMSWKKFKDDPYNSYIRGLQDLVEDETINLTRRNEMLDHLLARHGESPLLINTVIEGSIYTGNSDKDKIIIKSLYLQNLGLLSYYRFKGYNYLGAKKIEKIELELPLNLEQLLIDVSSVRFYLESEKDIIIPKNEKFENDFIFNTNKVDQIEKIRKQDFINYAALELQLNILLSLKTPYINYLENTLNNLEEKKCILCEHTQSQSEKCQDCKNQLEQIQQCLWFLKERRGLVCIENCLLYPFDNSIVITQSTKNGPYYKIKNFLSYTETIVLNTLLANATSCTIDTNSNGIELTINGTTTYELIETTQTVENINWEQVATIGSNCFFGISSENSPENAETIETITLLFPDYIPYFNTDYFKNRLDTLLENTLPIEVSYSYRFVSQENLNRFIPAFIDWHNNLVFNNSTYKKTTEVVSVLSNIMNKIPKE